VAEITGPDFTVLGRTVTVLSGGKFRGLIKGVGQKYLMVLVNYIDIGHGMKQVKSEIRKFPYPVMVVPDG